MASLPHANRVTYEEWLRMPEVDNAKEEVVDGQIHIMPPPTVQHAKIAQRLCNQFVRQVDDREVFATCSIVGLVIQREPLVTREPDVAVFRTRTIVERDGRVESPPELIAEVLSPANTRSAMDRKLADYVALGVPEVWLISPEGLTVEVLHLEHDYYRRVAIVADGALTPREFPDVQVEIARIWPD
jgi:Uma2 family endonuclease